MTKLFTKVMDLLMSQNAYGTKSPSGALVSLSGPGKVLVYDDDVAGAMLRLVDTTIDFKAGSFSMLGMDTITSPSTRAQYFRIVPDRVVERVCEVREVPRG